MQLEPVELLVFISLIADMSSFLVVLVAGFYEIIFVIGISVNDLTIYITSSCCKKVVKCFSFNFRIRFSFFVYVYGFDLFMRVCLKTDNRSNPIPGFLRVVFEFFKIALPVT